MSMWERFDNLATAEEVVSAKNEFTPIAEGEYEVILEELKPDETQSGIPKISGKFRTMTNRVIFYNQLLQNVNNPQFTAKNIAQAVDTLSVMLGEDITFVSMSQLESKIYEVQTGTKFKIEVSYGKNDFDKKFPNVKVIEKLNENGSAGFMNIPDGIDQELPFN